MNSGEAYRACESQTRAAAANFYYGIRLLPGEKRRAMCAVYAFARRIDDIGDGPLPDAEKLARLEQAAAALAPLRDGGGTSGLGRGGGGAGTSGGGGRGGGAIDPRDPVLVALADARARFELPVQSLEDLIAGVRMDVEGAEYPTFDALLPYCRRVAGSIGRLCLAIFGSSDPDAAPQLADDLGVAMQLTNILRDLREDAERGRVYTPAEDLVRYHLHDSGALRAPALLELIREGTSAAPEVIAGFDGGDVGQLYALMRFQALRARDWFHRGMPLLALLDRRSAACVMAMTGIYRRLLEHIEDRPDRALAARESLRAHEKARVAVGALARPRRVPEQHPAERML